MVTFKESDNTLTLNIIYSLTFSILQTKFSINNKYVYTDVMTIIKTYEVEVE